MEGIFITTPNSATIRGVIDKIFSAIGVIFLNENRYGHRFVIKGSLPFGDIAHGKNIDEHICDKLANEPDYKRSIMCGLPCPKLLLPSIQRHHLVYIYMSQRETLQTFKANIMVGLLIRI